MIKEMLRNKDLLVFWTAMGIAACDVFSSGFFVMQEVVAAPAAANQSAAHATGAEEAAVQRWVKRMERISAR